MATLTPQRPGAGEGGVTHAPPRKHSLTKSFLTAKTSSTLAPTPGPAGEDTRPELHREFSEDLSDVGRKEKKDLPQIQVALYRKYCQRYNVTPVGVFLRNPSTAKLNLNHYSLGPLGALALSVPLMIGTSLTHLNLEGNAIGDEGIRHIETCLQESLSLTNLNLNDNSLGRVGAEVMGHVLLDNKTLTTVSLAGNLFKDSDAVFFTQILTGSPSSTVKEINLSRNHFGDGAAILFAKALVDNTTLEVLDLSWNHIRPAGGIAIMNGVKENVALKRLRLSYNGIGSEKGCEHIMQALESNRTLLELDIAGNRITDNGMLYLAKGIKKNDILQILKVGENVVTGLGAQALGEAILESEECNVTLLDLTKTNVFESLVFKCKERVQPGPLTLINGPVTRYMVEREELEKRWMEEWDAVNKHDAELPLPGAEVGSVPATPEPSTGDPRPVSAPRADSVVAKYIEEEGAPSRVSSSRVSSSRRKSSSTKRPNTEPAPVTRSTPERLTTPVSTQQPEGAAETADQSSRPASSAKPDQSQQPEAESNQSESDTQDAVEPPLVTANTNEEKEEAEQSTSSPSPPSRGLSPNERPQTADEKVTDQSNADDGNDDNDDDNDDENDDGIEDNDGYQSETSNVKSVKFDQSDVNTEGEDPANEKPASDDGRESAATGQRSADDEDGQTADG